MNEAKQENHAISNAKGWLESVVDMLNRLREAEDGEMECGQCEGTGETQSMSNLEDEPCPVCDGTGTIESELDEDAIRQEIQESPLSVEVRSDWHTPGSEDADAGEYRILLTTGGPALQLVGDLDQWKQPDSARLEWQDWGTPWTQLHGLSSDEEDALLTFAQSFWFGE